MFQSPFHRVKPNTPTMGHLMAWLIGPDTEKLIFAFIKYACRV